MTVVTATLRWDLGTQRKTSGGILMPRGSTKKKGSKWWPSASPEENLEQIHPSCPSEETNPASTLNLQIWEKIKLCSLRHQFIVFCYRSSRKLTQTRRKIPKLFIWGNREHSQLCWQIALSMKESLHLPPEPV